MEQQNQQSQPPVFNQPQQPMPQQMPQYQPRVTASPMMDLVTAVKTCFSKYANFKGRARRSEFWWFVLFVLIVNGVLLFLSGFMPWVGYLSLLFGLCVIVPQLAALTRRLHDSSRSGWWVVLFVVGMIIYYGSYAMLLGSHADMILNSDSADPMELVQIMADAVQHSPTTAGIMMISSLCSLILALILIIFACFDSKWGENKYGPSPKYQ